MATVRCEGSINILFTPFEVGVRHFRLAFSEGTPNKLTQLVNEKVLYPSQGIPALPPLTLGERVKHIVFGLLETVGYLTLVLPFIALVVDRTLNKSSSCPIDEIESSEIAAKTTLSLADFILFFENISGVLHLENCDEEKYQKYSASALIEYNAKLPGFQKITSDAIPLCDFETGNHFHDYVHQAEDFQILKGSIGSTEYICLIRPNSNAAEKKTYLYLRK